MAADAKKTITRTDPSSSSTTHEGVRDTLESIVVAFILAFVFRAFVVEAFVIPTGSMAASLYGEHNTHTCTDCGYEYAFGRSRDDRQRLMAPSDPLSTCPNCGFHYRVSDSERANVEAGDRILVLKWPFDIGGKYLGPRRWEPTVFKDPADGKTNFIKRLVGCPGEVLELIDGDVYTAPLADLQRTEPALVANLREIRRHNYRRMELQQGEDHLGGVDSKILRERAAINQELASLQEKVIPVLNKHLRIQRKTPDLTRAQRSLWFVVFDQDYLPWQRAAGVGWKPVLPPGAPSAWDTSQRTVRFLGADRSLEAVRLAGRPPHDCYAYNFDGDRPRGRPAEFVADRRLRCLFTPLAGDGRFQMRLTKYNDEFVAELSPNEGKATLTMVTRLPDGKTRSTPIGTRALPLPYGKPVAVALTNVDYRVSLTIDDREILATNDDVYRPDIAFLRTRPSPDSGTPAAQQAEPVAELAAERLDLELRHLVLERDVYYTNPSLTEPFSQAFPNRRNPFCLDTDRSGRGGSPGWATEGNPILLEKGEYFMLGDNSPASKDSRLWWEVGPHLANRGPSYQVGTVPEDQLIGRAFFVYWPSGFQIPGLSRLNLIPNVGRMRWIR